MPGTKCLYLAGSLVPLLEGMRHTFGSLRQHASSRNNVRLTYLGVWTSSIVARSTAARAGRPATHRGAPARRLYDASDSSGTCEQLAVHSGLPVPLPRWATSRHSASGKPHQPSLSNHEGGATDTFRYFAAVARHSSTRKFIFWLIRRTGVSAEGIQTWRQVASRSSLAPVELPTPFPNRSKVLHECKLKRRCKASFRNLAMSYYHFS